MAHRFPYSLYHRHPDKGIAVLGRGSKTVTLHVTDAAWIDFRVAEHKILDMLNRIYWSDNLENNLPIHLVWNGEGLFPDLKMSEYKRLRVQRELTLVAREQQREDLEKELTRGAIV